MMKKRIDELEATVLMGRGEMDSLTKGWNKYVAERHVQQEIITLRKRVEELQKKNKRFLDLYQDYERSYKRAEAELARLCEGNAALLDAGVRQMQRAEKAEARVNELGKENKQLFDYTLTQGQAVQVFYEQGEQAKKRVAELEMCIKDGINQNTNQAAMALNYNAINRAEQAEKRVEELEKENKLYAVSDSLNLKEEVK
jgi:chromosome segregation ATPase